MHSLLSLHHPFTLWQSPPWLVDRLRADFPQHTFTQTENYSALGDRIAPADILIGWSIRPDQFARAARLKWIHSTAAAVHQLMFPELIASPVIITNAREVHAPVVAEHALALVFALAKLLPQSRDAQRTRTWAQQLFLESVPTLREVAGSTACLVGMGTIGREFTQRARALEMKVIAVREHPERGPDGADQVFGRAQLADALALADFVILAAPLTADTTHLINADTLRALRPHAYLINVGRGPLIDDSALIAALRERRLAGAALDVFAEEPLPASSPYWDLDNVFITPHTAAVTEKLWERQYSIIAANIRAFTSGAPLRGLGDKSRGY